jgi:YVTN family beta-propeller protein
LTVGVGPDAVGVDPSTDAVYVANVADDTVSVINGATNSVVRILAVGSSPESLAVEPSTDSIYVANFGDDTVSTIDGITNAVTGTLAVGVGPDALATNPASNAMYVANAGEGTVSVSLIAADVAAAASTSAGKSPTASLLQTVRSELTKDGLLTGITAKLLTGNGTPTPAPTLTSVGGAIKAVLHSGL